MSRPKRGETGCKEANDKWRRTVTEKYGGVTEFMREVGRMGGSKSHPETRPFAKNPELASRAGKKGGKTSSRAGIKNKKPRVVKEKEEAPVEEKKGILGWFSGRKDR